IIARAPRPFSSAGWKISTTRPVAGGRAAGGAAVAAAGTAGAVRCGWLRWLAAARLAAAGGATARRRRAGCVALPARRLRAAGCIDATVSAPGTWPGAVAGAGALAMDRRDGRATWPRRGVDAGPVAAADPGRDFTRGAAGGARGGIGPGRNADRHRLQPAH